MLSTVYLATDSLLSPIDWMTDGENNHKVWKILRESIQDRYFPRQQDAVTELEEIKR